MKYRIKAVTGLGFFAQVKKHGLFGGWRTLGSHPYGQIGEYEENNLSHPLELMSEALMLIESHNKKSEMITATSYKDVTPISRQKKQNCTHLSNCDDLT